MNYESANRQTKTAVRLIESSPASTSSKNGSNVEAESLSAFDRLDIQAMSETDPYTLQEHLSLLDCKAGLLVEMPERFEDLMTARHFFNLVVWHKFFLLAQMSVTVVSWPLLLRHKSPSAHPLLTQLT
jgi:hypothetical protein